MTERLFTNIINGRRVRAVPRLYLTGEAEGEPGSWWYPSSPTTVTLKCFRMRGEEHTFQLNRSDFDEDGVLKDPYTHVKCINDECDADLGRAWLVDFHGRMPGDP